MALWKLFLTGLSLTARQPGWTFYPKGQPRITLTVDYVLGLGTLAGAGYLKVGTITAYMIWVNYRIFNAGDQPLEGTLRLADPELIGLTRSLAYHEIRLRPRFHGSGRPSRIKTWLSNSMR